MANTMKRLGWISVEPCLADRLLQAIVTLGPCSRRQILDITGEKPVGSCYPTIHRMIQSGLVREIDKELTITFRGRAKNNMMIAVRAAATKYVTEISRPEGGV